MNSVIDPNRYTTLLKKCQENGMLNGYVYQFFKIEDMIEYANYYVLLLSEAFHYDEVDKNAVQFFALVDYITYITVDRLEKLKEALGEDYDSLSEDEKQEIAFFFDHYRDKLCNMYRPTDMARFVGQLMHRMEYKFRNEQVKLYADKKAIASSMKIIIKDVMATAHKKKHQEIFNLGDYCTKYNLNIK